MRIIFFGTSTFAIPILKALLPHYEMVAVVTKPDEPMGRHHMLTSPPVKQLLLEVKPPNIEILQPEKLSTILPRLQELKPDMIVLASYGKIIPQALLNLPRLGCINVHPSLLPRHRGASPLQYTILNGDTETGVSIMKMDAEVDHGPILERSNLEISRFDLQKLPLPELTQKLSELGAQLLIQILPDYIAGRITPQEQDHSKATFTKMFTKNDGHMDFKKSAITLERMVRALNPWPGTFSRLSLEGRGPAAGGGEGAYQIFKILKARILHPQIGCAADPRPGVLWLTEHKELAVNANPGSLILEQVQPQGKKSMTGMAFINGHKEVLGTQMSCP